VLPRRVLNLQPPPAPRGRDGLSAPSVGAAKITHLTDLDVFGHGADGVFADIFEN
jgi:hypothetical protein